jgi:hypothetical protein
MQRRIVGIINPRLCAAGAELRETGIDGGYPVFSVVSVGLARIRQPKNLIFASYVKPDIRFRDAIDNDIEIVENADKVLVYDRPIGSDGIRWRDLQAWWKDTQQFSDDDEAKKSLDQRLASSLPGNSPPQRNLYDLYHKIHGSAVPDFPALLPEVWLHWDPQTVRERGRDALLRHRMDFLLLMPHGQRVVLEVDGSHHYATPDGKRPDATRYAANMRADRELKLSGYEVFRFGATELQRPRPRPRDTPAVLRRPVPAVRRNPLTPPGPSLALGGRLRRRGRILIGPTLAPRPGVRWLGDVPDGLELCSRSVGVPPGPHHAHRAGCPSGRLARAILPSSHPHHICLLCRISAFLVSDLDQPIGHPGCMISPSVTRMRQAKPAAAGLPAPPCGSP